MGDEVPFGRMNAGYAFVRISASLFKAETLLTDRDTRKAVSRAICPNSVALRASMQVNAAF